MFKEKTVLIAGSTSGIGLAIADAFASQSTNIILNGVESIRKSNPILGKMSRKTQEWIKTKTIEIRHIKYFKSLQQMKA